MGSEAQLWTALRPLLTQGKGWRAQRIETSTAGGVPDVYYNLAGVRGWLELKHRHAWPKRPQTVVRLPGYTDAQRAWLGHEGACGGEAWLLLQVERDYLLFDWRGAQRVGHLTKTALFDAAAWRGTDLRGAVAKLAREVVCYY